jgi:flagellar hook-length control protein FliK
MSFDALIMPPAPPPPAGGAGGAPGTQPAGFEFDRPAHSIDQDQRFLATLNRACERKSCNSNRSRGDEFQNAGPDEASPVAARYKDEAFENRPAESEAGASAADLPSDRRRSSLNLIHQVLLNIPFAADGAAAIKGQSDSNGSSMDAFVNQLIGQVYADRSSQLPSLLGIGPFEQLQADISAQANNLQFFKQLANRALNEQLAANPAGLRAEHPFFEFWCSLAAAPAEGAGFGGRGEAVAVSVDDLIHFLLQRYGNTSAASGLAAATTGNGGQKAAVTMEAVAANENLLQKIIEPKQPAEIQALIAGKDDQGSAGTAKNVIAEALWEARSDKNGEDAPATRMQSGSKTAAPAVNPNLAGQNGIARPAEEAFSLKTSALHNDMLSADQTGNKVMQIDGESKDSGLLTSQENLPEHLAKLGHSGRSTEGTQRSLASQTLNQIVQKAVLLNNNGQNMVQIDLKPDILGQIRMQIMTESQQVAVRIVAELPIVKDMLESNLNQLKAELQAQGLQVDELEVSVAHDSRAEDDRYQKAAELRRARASRNNHISAEEETESQKAGTRILRDGMAQTAVDYFA